MFQPGWRPSRPVAAALFGVALAIGPAVAADDDPLEIDITGTDLAELFEIDVTTVSRTTERYQNSAAAVFILTADEIRRSGVTSVPDALRLVPGVQVSRVDASKWAVSIRGFHGRTSNKLLVMVDGRSVYNPLFAGVLWEARDVMLEEIEQIEIVRGPGGSLWGANAVNGVINIITRRADRTRGTLVVAGGGVGERAFTSARHGWGFGRSAHARVYLKGFERDEGHAPTGDAADDWRSTRAGFRIDWGDELKRSFTLQGDVYAATVGESVAGGGARDVDHSGGNLGFRWERAGDRIRRVLRAWVDRTELDNPILGERRDTVDVEYQEQHTVSERGALVWGLGYRLTSDEIEDGPALEVEPDSRDDTILSGFAHGTFRLPAIDGRLQAGLKVEHDDYTGTEFLPSASWAWTPDERRTLWAKLARAVRSPSRLEADLVSPIEGPATLRTEELWAWELGFRWRPTTALTLDAAAFRNDYDRLLTVEGTRLGNELSGQTYGLETALTARLRPTWRLDVVYDLLRLDLELDPSSVSGTPASFYEGQDPRHRVLLRSVADLSRVPVELDATLRWVDELPALGVDAYATLDLRVGWRVGERVTLSVIGRDLLESEHLEQAGETTTGVEPSVFVRLRWER